MKRTRLLLPALLAVTALLGAACANDEPAVDTSGPSTTASKGPPAFDAGTTMAALQQKGKMVVGTKFDQPGFGLSNPTTGKVEGFDVEVAKLIAVGIFGGSVDDVDSKIEFKESISANRETFIENGEVDMVVATYTINDARKQRVDFAGPYFVAEQDIMVKSSDTSITKVEDLNGKKVCTVKGSTSEKNLRAKAPSSDVTLLDTYSQCAESLTDDRVVAVTTDNTILAGLVQASGGEFKLVKEPFSDEPYGIGIKRGDDAFRDFINDTLEEIFDNGEWAEAFESTLGRIGLDTPEPPTVDRYTAGGTAATTAGGTATTTAGGATTTTAAGSATTRAGGSTTTTTRP